MSSRPRKPSAIAEGPSDRSLVRLHWPFHLRPAFDVLFEIDDAMAEVVISASQPALAAIKLAWWRESLEKLDVAAPPAEPRLRAAAEELLPRGVTGRELARLETGWAELLQETPDPVTVVERGAVLFRIGGRLLGDELPEAILADLGTVFAQADAARRGLTDPGQRRADLPAVRIPASARPITALAALAARDLRRGNAPLEPEATPARSWTLIRHRLTGRL